MVVAVAIGDDEDIPDEDDPVAVDGGSVRNRVRATKDGDPNGDGDGDGDGDALRLILVVTRRDAEPSRTNGALVDDDRRVEEVVCGGGVAMLRPAAIVRLLDGDAARHGRDILNRGRSTSLITNHY
jgi:hypothetical protein